MPKDLTQSDVAQVLSETTCRVKPEDRRYVAEVFREQEGDFRTQAAAIGRQETVTGQIYDRTIGQYSNAPSRPKARGSSFRLVSAGHLTFETGNKRIRALGYVMSGVLLTAMFYLGISVRIKLQQLDYQNKKISAEMEKAYFALKPKSSGN